MTSDEKKLINACRNGDLHTVKHLIEKGVNINVKDKYLWTPLIHTVYNVHMSMIEYLLSKGADLTIKDYMGRNCFHWSARRWKEYDIQKAIMDNYPNGYQILKENDIEIDSRIKEEYPEENISDELGFFESVNELTLDEEKLFKSINISDLDTIKELIEKGVKIGRAHV